MSEWLGWRVALCASPTRRATAAIVASVKGPRLIARLAVTITFSIIRKIGEASVLSTQIVDHFANFVQGKIGRWLSLTLMIEAQSVI